MNRSLHVKTRCTLQRIFAQQYADRVLALGTARFQLRNFEVEDLITEPPCDEGTKTDQDSENQEVNLIDSTISYENSMTYNSQTTEWYVTEESWIDPTERPTAATTSLTEMQNLLDKAKAFARKYLTMKELHKINKAVIKTRLKGGDQLDVRRAVLQTLSKVLDPRRKLQIEAEKEQLQLDFGT
ncbi:hypothetical protein Ddc_06818 [Ditylenchus destructor]|nr:hypothetical protein Ddc_06818 [Ditylenchus destructor]